jgi:predicted nucleic acid-binding protein
MRQHPVEKVRLDELSREEALFAAGLLARADVELLPMRPYLEAATAIAIALDHPAYDCLYIACAEAAGLRFVTADAGLVHKIAAHAAGRYAGRVVELGNSGAWQE